MLLLIVFAFLAGVFTILSPCILPILPVILSASTLKGRWRPLGIIIGFVIAFSFFTLTLSAIVHATGLSANFLRYTAIAIIFLFGLVMLFPRLTELFTKLSSPLANLGQQLQVKQSGNGFLGGILFGMALGLLWTPCAGPILAAITTLVATQAVTFFTVIITLAYSLGAGIPMFFIAYGGAKVIHSSKFLATHSEGLRQIFGGLMIVTAIALALNWDMILQQKISSFIPSILIEDNPLVRESLQELSGEKEEFFKIQEKAPPIAGGAEGTEALLNYGPAPEIVGIDNWINSKPLTIKDLKGKVVLIDFWTYSCINCLRTLSYLEKWDADYKDKGLVIIGVHTPEFEFEKDNKNVKNAAERLGVKYPVAQDNEYKTWQAYHNHYWPAHYLIDQNGNLRMIHFGEGKYVETENAIRQLLGMQPLKMQEPERKIRPTSPETYLGTSRGSDNYTSENHIQPDQIALYDYHGTLAVDQIGLKGRWKVESERITSESNDSFLDMHFLSKKVYLVMSGKSEKPVVVFLDGKKVGEFTLDADRKYDIVDAPYGQHQLSLQIPSGISAYAFTFGDE